MATDFASEEVLLPESWPSNVKSAILQVISLARLAVIYSRSWAAKIVNARVRLQEKLERASLD